VTLAAAVAVAVGTITVGERNVKVQRIRFLRRHCTSFAFVPDKLASTPASEGEGFYPCALHT